LRSIYICHVTENFVKKNPTSTVPFIIKLNRTVKKNMDLRFSAGQV